MVKETCSFDETVQFARIVVVWLLPLLPLFLVVGLEVKTSKMPLLWMHTSSNKRDWQQRLPEGNLGQLLTSSHSP